MRNLYAINLANSPGIVVDIQRALFDLAESDPATYQAAFDVILWTANDPSILGMATHLLYVGRRLGGERVDLDRIGRRPNAY